jgi:EpsI family protein
MPSLANLLVVALLLTGLLFAFAEPLMAMVRQWDVSPMYSYAYVVPPISAYLLWSRRDALSREPVRPARLAAVPLLLLALVMHAVGAVAAIQLLQQLAFIVTIAGIVLYAFGWRHFVLSAPALGYLLFMVPLWDVFTEHLHAPFQNNSARLGVWLVRLIDVPAYREDVIISLPNVTLEVARACSGVNYLVAVLALALPLAFLRLDRMWRRAVLIVSAVAIAALANGVRVALIAVLAYYEVGSPLHGPFHVLHGLFVAAVGYVALFAGLRLLRSPESRSDASMVKEAAPVRVGLPALPARWSADLGGLAILMWAVALAGFMQVTTPVTLAAPLDRLPTRLGSWTAETTQTSAAEGSVPAWRLADEYIRRSYRSDDGRKAVVEVWYFEMQRQNRELVNFEASDLHRRASRVAVPLAAGTSLQANVIDWPERKEVGMFWYEIGGVAEADPLATKMRGAWNGLVARHSNGAVVMLRTDALPGFEQGSTALQTLAAALHPALVPHWTSR